MNIDIKKNNLDYAEAHKAYMLCDFDRAYEIWHVAAELGDADAQAWIGSMYANGDGKEIDYHAAHSWYLKAALQGHSMSQSNVGVNFYTGIGVEKNLDQAIYWLSAAAEKDDLKGLFNLAVLYSKGSVPEFNSETSEKMAAELYRRAAVLGHYPSQSRLGYLYSIGKGVPKNRTQAYLWLTLAAQHGIGTTLDALESVVKDMSSEEKSEGMRLFNEWRLITRSNEGPVAIHPSPA
jgi:uncharacterized protein